MMPFKEYFHYDGDDWKKCEPIALVEIIKDCLGLLKGSYNEFEKINVYRSLWEALQTNQNKSISDELDKKSIIKKTRFYEFKRGYFYLWFRICRDTDDKNINFYFSTTTIKGKALDREEYISRLIWDENANLSDFFGQNRVIDSLGRHYLRFLVDWFLKRYDLLTASVLLKELKNNREKKYQRVNPKSFISALWSVATSFPFWVFCGMFFSLIVIPIWLPPTEYGNKLEIYPRFFFYNINSSRIGDYFIYLHLNLIFVVPVLLLLIFVYIRNYDWIGYKIILPRMIGSIFIGYIPFIMTDEIWKWLLSFKIEHVITIAGLATLLSFVYLFFEVYNITQKRWLSLERAIKVGVIGLIESLIIGFYLSDLFSNIMLKNLGLDDLDITEKINPVFGMFGIYVPQALLCYFPIALLIGIFLQIFWEEKPITYPI